MISNINHIGIAVKSIEEHIIFYKDVLGFEFIGTEEVADQNVKTAIFKIGEMLIELLEPTISGSTIDKFIENKGEGLHHIAYQTDDIQKQIETTIENGIRMIDESPREGVQNTRIAFLHPKFSGKVLTELVES